LFGKNNTKGGEAWTKKFQVTLITEETNQSPPEGKVNNN